MTVFGIPEKFKSENGKPRFKNKKTKLKIMNTESQNQNPESHNGSARDARVFSPVTGAMLKSVGIACDAWLANRGISLAPLNTKDGDFCFAHTVRG